MKMELTSRDNLNDLEVRDKFDLSRIVIRIVFDDKITFVAEVACVATRLIIQEQSYILYNLSLCISVVYYLIFLVMNL